MLTSFYLHWPFCPYRCHFCPFVALAGHDQYMEQYHDVITKEITTYLDEFGTVPLKTIFIGGGTPSTYPPELMNKIISLLRDRCGFEPDCEISIEVNPGTVDKEKLLAWKEIGVNRLSIGVQSLNDEVLRKLNRHQKAKDVYWLIENASALFDNLSIDIIVGLPGVGPDEWKAMIEKVVTWPINHVSMYFLTVHEDTQLYFGIKSKKVTLPCDDEVVDLYYWTIEEFSKVGLEQYEISNFSRPGWHSKHNSMYWQRTPYKGFGMGACSFDGNKRTKNTTNLLKYLEEIGHTGKSIMFEEALTDKQEWLEQLMLGLRQRKGLHVATILEPLSTKKREEFSSRAEELLAACLVSETEGILKLTPKGLSVANEVIVRLSCL